MAAEEETPVEPLKDILEDSKASAGEVGAPFPQWLDGTLYCSSLGGSNLTPPLVWAQHAAIKHFLSHSPMPCLLRDIGSNVLEQH